MKFGPGDHIESRCTRCHDITGHVIIALVDGAIAKVVCQACGSTHKYYPPKKTSTSKSVVNSSKKISNATSSSKNTSRAQSISISKRQKMLEEVAEIWQKAINTCIGTPKVYNMNSAFIVGDVIDHATFGKGVVQEVLYPDKMQILFKEGIKLLKCSH